MELIDFFTFLLFIATFLLWSETYKMRKEQTKPILSLLTKPHNQRINYILLSVGNCGFGLAKNIKMKTNSEFPVTYNLESHQTIPLKELGVFSHPFNMGSNQNFDFILKFLPEDYETLRANGQLVINISADYEDLNNKKYTQDFIVDLEIFQHLSFVIEN